MGHLHYGYPYENKLQSIALVKILDLLLGTFLIPFENAKVSDSIRRQFYGKAGSYRRTPGVKVEYRTPSNIWLFNEGLMNTVYDISSKAVELAINTGYEVPAEYQQNIQDYINSNGLIPLKKEIIKHRNDLLKKEKYA